MYSGLIIILLPLFAGYLLPVRHKKLLSLVNAGLTRMVYIILFLMGISLAFVDNLATNLLVIARISLTSAACVLLCNFIALRISERFISLPARESSGPLPSRLHMVLDSLKMCLVVVAGFGVGLSHWSPLHHATRAGEYALLVMLFLIGIQLRSSGMSLRQILFNRQGSLIALVVIVSALPAGMITALLLGLPLHTGLAMTSGYGWYSLSGILMTNAFGPVIGSSAFLSDLIRELVSIVLIPVMIRRYAVTIVGICGATSMDFTLPVLQRAGGNAIVPVAVVNGFITSLMAPVMIALFSV